MCSRNRPMWCIRASNTYNVHECEQVLLDMLLPVKLDHWVIHAQQHLDVVRPLQALPAHSPRAGVVDALLHALVQRIQVHQGAEVGTCRHSMRKKWWIYAYETVFYTPIGMHTFKRLSLVRCVLSQYACYFGFLSHITCRHGDHINAKCFVLLVGLVVCDWTTHACSAL